jgi:hypothetical protein
MAAAAEPSRSLEVELEPPQAVGEGRDEEAAALALEGEAGEVRGAAPARSRACSCAGAPPSYQLRKGEGIL